MPTKQLLIDVVSTLLNAITAVGASASVALPSRAVVLILQVNLDATPVALALDLEVSLDGVNFVSIENLTQADFTNNTALIVHSGPVAAKFIRVHVTSNATPAVVTALLLAKISNA